MNLEGKELSSRQRRLQQTLATSAAMTDGQSHVRRCFGQVFRLRFQFLPQPFPEHFDLADASPTSQVVEAVTGQLRSFGAEGQHEPAEAGHGVHGEQVGTVLAADALRRGVDPAERFGDLARVAAPERS